MTVSKGCEIAKFFPVITNFLIIWYQETYNNKKISTVKKIVLIIQLLKK